MIPNEIVARSGYEGCKLAKKIQRRKQNMCGAITKRILQLILDLAISPDSEALQTDSELNRLEIIKFMNGSLGTSGTSNHPRLGKLQKDPCVWNCD
jgi:hypothetical protein